MIASCQKISPEETISINDQVIDLSNDESPTIVILEEEYLRLKSNAGYWRAMHAKSVAREKKLKEIIKEQKGQIKDLQNRLFGKKSEKKKVAMEMIIQGKSLQSALAVSNPAARGMDLHNGPMFQKNMKKQTFQKRQYVLNAANLISPMKVRNHIVMKLKSRLIPASLNVNA